jgi:hypothetical protein
MELGCLGTYDHAKILLINDFGYFFPVELRNLRFALFVVVFVLLA